MGFCFHAPLQMRALIARRRDGVLCQQMVTLSVTPGCMIICSDLLKVWNNVFRYHDSCSTCACSIKPSKVVLCRRARGKSRNGGPLCGAPFGRKVAQFYAKETSPWLWKVILFHFQEFCLTTSRKPWYLVRNFKFLNPYKCNPACVYHLVELANTNFKGKIPLSSS